MKRALLVLLLLTGCADGGRAQCERDWDHLLAKPHYVHGKYEPSESDAHSDWVYYCMTASPGDRP